MNLSKNQIVLAGIGGVTFLSVAVLGYLVFSASGEKAEAEDSLDTAISSVERLYNAKISPDAASIKEIKDNATALSDWRAAGLLIASEGDQAFPKGVNEAAFKQQMVDEAREMSKLPGAVSGALVVPEFPFGFKQYIVDGNLPEAERLPLLQRQWSDIKKIVAILAESGVSELQRIDPVSKVDAVQQQAQETGKKAKKAKKKSKGNEESADHAVPESYILEFRARPAALVKVVDALAVDKRFFAVDAFSFVRESDMIQTSIVGDKDRAASSGSRRRRRRAVESEEVQSENTEKKDDTRKHGVVNDPVKEGPFAVTMTISTYDFGMKSAETPVVAADEPKEEPKEEESKDEEEEE